MPLNQGNWSAARVFALCVQHFKDQWLPCSAASLVALVLGFTAMIGMPFLLFTYGAQILGGTLATLLALAFGALGLVLNLGLALGMTRIALDVLEGREVATERLFSQFSKLHLLIVPVVGLGAVMVALRLLGSLVSLGAFSGGLANPFGPMLVTLVAQPLSLFVLTVLLFVIAAVVVRPATNTLSQTAQLLEWVREARGQVLGVLALGAAFLFGGFLLCGLGLIPAYAFVALLCTALARALSTPAE